MHTQENPNENFFVSLSDLQKQKLEKASQNGKEALITALEGFAPADKEEILKHFSASEQSESKETLSEDILNLIKKLELDPERETKLTYLSSQAINTYGIQNDVLISIIKGITRGISINIIFLVLEDIPNILKEIEYYANEENQAEIFKKHYEYYLKVIRKGGYRKIKLPHEKLSASDMQLQNYELMKKLIILSKRAFEFDKQ